MANVIKHKRGSGSDPSASDLILGELAIRTDNGKLFTKMDSGAIAEIAGGGSDIAINTLSSSSATGGGSATFNGSAYRFTLSSPPSVSAAQLLVSINGVIQKPVAGTGQPSEGFSVDGNDIILGDAPATGSDFFILTFRSLGVSEPADNSVTSAKIVDGAIVNADINASAAITGTKISPDFGSQTITTTGTVNTGLINASSASDQILNLNSSDNGAVYLAFKRSGGRKAYFGYGGSGNTINLANEISDGDITIVGNDGGSNINMLSFNTSENGRATFIGNVNVGAGLDVTGSVAVSGSTDGVLNLDTSDSRGAFVRFGQGGSFHNMVGCADGLITGLDKEDLGIRATDKIGFSTNGDNIKMIILSGGNVGIGTTSPRSLLDLGAGSGDGSLSTTLSEYQLMLEAPQTTGDYGRNIGWSVGTNGLVAAINAVDVGTSDSTGLAFITGNNSAAAERIRIDSGGHLLVAHTSTRNNFNSAVSSEHAPIIQLEGENQKRALSITATNNNDGGILMLARQNGNPGTNTVVSEDNQIGRVDFQASGGTNMELAAQITAEVDGTPGNDDMPGRLLFKTTADGSNNPTERMRIDSSGISKFVTGLGSTSSDNDVVHIVAGGTANRGIKIGTGRASGASQNDGMGYIDAINSESNGYGSQLQFRIDGTAVMTIGYNSDDYVGIGTTAPNKPLHVDSQSSTFNHFIAEFTGVNSTNAASLNFFYMGCGSDDNRTGLYWEHQNVSNVRMWMDDSSNLRQQTSNPTANNSGTAFSYAGGSDYRLKTNVVNYTNAITELKQLKPYKFNYIETDRIIVDKPDVLCSGFYAHEAGAVVPQSLIGEKDEVDFEGNPVYQSLKYEKFVPLLVAAVQELTAKVEALEAK